MKIVVCVKQVVDPDSQLVIDNLEVRASSGPSLRMNEFDEYALEAAITIKEKQGVEVTAITLGSLSSVGELNKAIAMGADRAIRIDSSVLERWDASATATVLAGAIKQVGFDLILCGVQATDDLHSQVGILIAELLGVPHSFAVTQIEEGQDARTVKVTKELGGGLKQLVEVPLPAVLIIQSGINVPRYVSTLALLKSRSKKAEGVSASSYCTMEELNAAVKIKPIELQSPRKKKSELIEGTPGEIAHSLVGKLREAKLL